MSYFGRLTIFVKSEKWDWKWFLILFYFTLNAHASNEMPYPKDEKLLGLRKFVDTCPEVSPTSPIPQMTVDLNQKLFQCMDPVQLLISSRVSWRWYVFIMNMRGLKYYILKKSTIAEEVGQGDKTQVYGQFELPEIDPKTPIVLNLMAMSDGIEVRDILPGIMKSHTVRRVILPMDEGARREVFNVNRQFGVGQRFLCFGAPQSWTKKYEYESNLFDLLKVKNFKSQRIFLFLKRYFSDPSNMKELYRFCKGKGNLKQIFETLELLPLQYLPDRPIQKRPSPGQPSALKTKHPVYRLLDSISQSLVSGMTHETFKETVDLVVSYTAETSLHCICDMFRGLCTIQTGSVQGDQERRKIIAKNIVGILLEQPVQASALHRDYFYAMCAVIPETTTELKGTSITTYTYFIKVLILTQRTLQDKTEAQAYIQQNWAKLKCMKGHLAKIGTSQAAYDAVVSYLSYPIIFKSHQHYDKLYNQHFAKATPDQSIEALHLLSKSTNLNKTFSTLYRGKDPAAKLQFLNQVIEQGR